VSESNEPSNLDVHTVIGYSCNRFQFAACPAPRLPGRFFDELQRGTILSSIAREFHEVYQNSSYRNVIAWSRDRAARNFRCIDAFDFNRDSRSLSSHSDVYIEEDVEEHLGIRIRYEIIFFVFNSSTRNDLIFDRSWVSRSMLKLELSEFSYKLELEIARRGTNFRRIDFNRDRFRRF